MLIEMLPTDVTRYWDQVKKAVDSTLPRDIPQRITVLNNVFSALINRRIQCWAYRESSKEPIIALVLTLLRKDAFSEESELVICSVYSFKLVPEEAWVDVLRTLQRYAVGRGCWRVVAYTNVPRIRRMIEGLGGSTEYTFAAFPVNTNGRIDAEATVIREESEGREEK